MVVHMEEVPKMVSRSGLQRRTVEEIVVFLWYLQRTVEQDLDEIDKTTPQERISGRMSVPIGAIEVPKISRQDVGVVKTTPQERISERSQVIEVPKTWRLGTAEVVTRCPSGANS